jgi:hypothetical protein
LHLWCKKSTRTSRHHLDDSLKRRGLVTGANIADKLTKGNGRDHTRIEIYVTIILLELLQQVTNLKPVAMSDSTPGPFTFEGMTNSHLSQPSFSLRAFPHFPLVSVGQSCRIVPMCFVALISIG